MANARKLPSGNWRVRAYVGKGKDGKKKYKSFTASTRTAAEFLAAQWNQERPEEEPQEEILTVGEVVDQYIDLSQTLSPTTLARYRTIRDHALPGLMIRDIRDLTDQICQQEIDRELKRPNKQTGRPLAPKTIREEWALVSSSLKMKGLSYSVKLPKLQKLIKELPPPELVIKAIQGTEIELPCLLSIWLSFSLSEIRGLRASSVRNGKIYIDQVIVQVEGLPVEKRETKVATRRRFQSVPAYLMDLIKRTDAFRLYEETGKDGFLCPYTENVLYHRLRKILKDAGISPISFHDLRHMFASIMLTKLQLPEKVVQDEGGWSSPHIMKSVYSNTFSDSRRQADEIRDAYFEDLL